MNLDENTDARATSSLGVGLSFAGTAFAMSVLAGLAGYSVEAEIYQDGKRAIGGFLHGYAVFAMVSLALIFGFLRTYRRRVGSLIWFALGAFLIPGALVAILALVSNAVLTD